MTRFKRKSILNNQTDSHVGRFTPMLDDYGTSPLGRPDYPLFQSKYYTSSDVNIYIGDIFIDEAVSISYEINESVIALSGYNSLTYDAIARGYREVGGSLVVNYLTSNYIRNVLLHSDAIELMLGEAIRTGDISIENLRQYKLKDILGFLGKTSFHEIAEAYKMKVWDFENPRIQENYGSDSADYSPFFVDLQGGVELEVTFGPETDVAKDRQMGEGYKEDVRYIPNVTKEYLNGVQFISMGKSIGGQGVSSEALVEYYSFLARDISGVSLRDQSLLEMEIRAMDDLEEDEEIDSNQKEDKNPIKPPSSNNPGMPLTGLPTDVLGPTTY